MSNPGVSREYELSGLRILVVDDEPDARELLVVVLQQYGAKVLAVESADRALEAMDYWKPDVIVSDIGMPGQDGYELMRRIRSLPGERGGHTPAAALTAFTRPEDRLEALASGFQTHIPKPLEPSALVAVLASLAGRTPKSEVLNSEGFSRAPDP
jgi:CheY-like chemotaxis protein